MDNKYTGNFPRITDELETDLIKKIGHEVKEKQSAVANI